MHKPEKRLQPSSYHAFQCAGAECEDTCCVGWIVNIDRATYEKYQHLEDPELGPRVRELVTINTTNSSDDNYARITLSSPACPFLEEGLCSIHKKLGQDHISVMCSTYPRVMNVVDDVLERSLDLSCPEAARLVLSDPRPMQFDSQSGELHEPRLGNMSVLQTGMAMPGKPYRYFRELRECVIWILQYRAYPLWKRLIVLGSFCDQLHEIAAADSPAEIPEFLNAYRDAVERDQFQQALDTHAPQPLKQLELALELIVGRISSDFTPARFQACYRDFMQGLEWTAESSLTDLGRRYATAFAEIYSPFMQQHDYILEHYLVSYVHRTLFPLGAQESSRGLSAGQSAQSIREQCLLMLTHYAVIQTLLIGLSAFYKAEFSAAHSIQAVQSFAKTFEHSIHFPAQTFRKLQEQDIKTAAGLAILIRN